VKRTECNEINLSQYLGSQSILLKGKGGRGEKKSTTASAKAGLQFPVGRIGRYLRQGVRNNVDEITARLAVNELCTYKPSI
jgi:hypothetical protein